MYIKSRIIQKILTCCSFSVLVGYSFAVAWPLVLVCSLFPGRKEQLKAMLHRRVCRFFRWYVRHGIWGVQHEMRNPYGETFDRPAIFIANHQSLLDMAAVLMLTDKVVAMTGQWVWQSPIYAPVMRFSDYFPVTMPFEQMTEHLRDCMKRGYSVLIFPEGTRSEDLQVHKFRRGAFCLAEQLQCDIVPVTIWGTGRILPKSDFCLTPGRLVVEIGPRTAFGSEPAGTEHGAMTRYWHRWFLQNYARLDEELAQPM